MKTVKKGFLQDTHSYLSSYPTHRKWNVELKYIYVVTVQDLSIYESNLLYADLTLDLFIYLLI